MFARLSREPRRQFAITRIGVQFLAIHALERIAQRRVLNFDGLTRATFRPIREFLGGANITSESLLR